MNERERQDAHEPGPGGSEGREGRPTGATDKDGLRAGTPHEEAPTEAPEERGQAPTVEHGPGADL